jgi:hypothetical protein
MDESPYRSPQSGAFENSPYKSVKLFALWAVVLFTLRFVAAFCRDCLRETREYDRVLELSTVNFVNGGRLLGSAKQCKTCGSTVKTHCFYLFGIPIFPAAVSVCNTLRWPSALSEKRVSIGRICLISPRSRQSCWHL